MHKLVDPRRIKPLNGKETGRGPVIYWMSRDQRVEDNWAMLYARELAMNNKEQMVVAFCLAPEFLGAGYRQFDFMIRGLMQVEKRLQGLRIPFLMLPGKPGEEIVRFSKIIDAGVVVTDFDPLKVKRGWKETAGSNLDCALIEVDAHNIVPCRIASGKMEYGAYTLRPKINRLLNEFLTVFPALAPQENEDHHFFGTNDWQHIHSLIPAGSHAPAAEWIIPGEKAAHRAMDLFIDGPLDEYASLRNDPNAAGQSGLSPYIHFGHLASQRIALCVKESRAATASKEAFLEELIVRKELSDNLCLYNPMYDSFSGFPRWAQISLDIHRKDERQYLYSAGELERSATHDDLWNAAQTEMVRTGRMHGYMRMYWAKKILEWTKDPEEAVKTAIYLNDAYELDGRDPNGYAGIAWAMGGLHDRPWSERPVFGKIRYMSYNGCRSKFNIRQYINRISAMAH